MSKPMQTSGGSILIAGGYGQVGKRITAELAPAYPGRVIVAGRDVFKAEALAVELGNGVRPERLDIHNPATVKAALESVDLVVNCIDPREPHLLRATIGRGLAYTDITAQPAFWRTAFTLEGEARKSGARILLGSGLIPGISNVMARAVVERVGPAASLHTALLLSIGDSFGPAALDYMLGASAHPFKVTEDRRERWVRNFTGGRLVRFPAPIGRRTVYHFALPDQVFYPQTLGARTAATRFALDPPWVMTLCVGVMGIGAGALLQRDRFRRWVVQLFDLLRKRYAGRDSYALVIEAEGTRGARRLSLVGRDESTGTASGAAFMARSLYEREIIHPGVWLPEQVIAPEPFFEQLAARGLEVRSE